MAQKLLNELSEIFERRDLLRQEDIMQEVGKLSGLHSSEAVLEALVCLHRLEVARVRFANIKREIGEQS